MNDETSSSKTQPLRLGFLFAAHQDGDCSTSHASRQLQVLSVTPDDLPVIIRLLLHEGSKDYILRKTKAGKSLLNRREEIVGYHFSIPVASELSLPTVGWRCEASHG